MNDSVMKAMEEFAQRSKSTSRDAIVSPMMTASNVRMVGNTEVFIPMTGPNESACV
jgi:hypothetical protein